MNNVIHVLFQFCCGTFYLTEASTCYFYDYVCVERQDCEAYVGTRIFSPLFPNILGYRDVERDCKDNICTEFGCLLWNVLLREGNKDRLIANYDSVNVCLRALRGRILNVFIGCL